MYLWALHRLLTFPVYYSLKCRHFPSYVHLICKHPILPLFAVEPFSLALRILSLSSLDCFWLPKDILFRGYCVTVAGTWNNLNQSLLVHSYLGLFLLSVHFCIFFFLSISDHSQYYFGHFFLRMQSYIHFKSSFLWSCNSCLRPSVKSLSSAFSSSLSCISQLWAVQWL